jgi:hypothetical protein
VNLSLTSDMTLAQMWILHLHRPVFWLDENDNLEVAAPSRRTVAQLALMVEVELNKQQEAT